MTDRETLAALQEPEWVRLAALIRSIDGNHDLGAGELADRLIAAGVHLGDEGLRKDGDGYEVRAWVRHQPSGIVVLPGHPQLGGRYCETDGGDWPCAAVRAALAETPDDH